MEDEMIIFNGVMVAVGEQIEEAQQETEYDFGDGGYPRVRYGEERRAWPAGPCHDCAVDQRIVDPWDPQLPLRHGDAPDHDLRQRHRVDPVQSTPR